MAKACSDFRPIKIQILISILMNTQKILHLSLFLLSLALAISCRKGEETIDELQKDAVNEIIAGAEVFGAPKAR